MRRFFFFFVGLFVFTAEGLTHADPAGKLHSIELPKVQVELKPGEGKETTERFCAICHSLDYITSQPPFSKAQWTGTVNKMRKVMGAPIPDKEAETIIHYLTGEYGTEK